MPAEMGKLGPLRICRMVTFATCTHEREFGMHHDAAVTTGILYTVIQFS